MGFVQCTPIQTPYSLQPFCASFGPLCASSRNCVETYPGLGSAAKSQDQVVHVLILRASLQLLSFLMFLDAREELFELCEGTVDRPGEAHQVTTSEMIVFVSLILILH